ncbi:hypothetical protein EniLVp02_0018 [Vibrio phage EniLVp02]
MAKLILSASNTPHINVERIRAAVHQFNEHWAEKYGKDNDWGCCGIAWVQVDFGRKRKIKQQLAPWFNSDGNFNISIRCPNDQRVQTLDYYEGRCDVIRDEIVKQFDEQGIDLYVSSRSFMD